MGTFLNIITNQKERGVLKENQEEMAERVKTLFHLGGMMNFDTIKYFNKKIYLLKPIEYVEYNEEQYIDFHYNYIKDEFWENAGYCKNDRQVYSNKVGWSLFNKVVSAAYELELLYSNAKGAVLDNDIRFHFDRACIAWINHIFDDDFTIVNEDRWEIYLLCQDDEYQGYRCDYSIDNLDSFLTVVSNFEIMSVENSIDKVLKTLTRYSGEYYIELLIITLHNMIDFISDYKDTHKQTDSYLKLMDCIQLYLEDNHLIDEDMKPFFLCLKVIDSIVLPIKIISELYALDFWTLYNKVKNYPRHRTFEDKKVFYLKTQDFVSASNNDLFYYWKEGGNIVISDEIEEWFNELYQSYLIYMEEKIIIENTFEWLIDILEYIQNQYCHIYAFTSFFKETLANLNDQRYLVLWKLLEEMAHDPQMLEEGHVIFQEDSEETNKSRRLYTEWCMMPLQHKFNPARMKLKRFMALIANNELRKKVFQF